MCAGAGGLSLVVRAAEDGLRAVEAGGGELEMQRKSTRPSDANGEIKARTLKPAVAARREALEPVLLAVRRAGAFDYPFRAPSTSSRAARRRHGTPAAGAVGRRGDGELARLHGGAEGSSSRRMSPAWCDAKPACCRAAQATRSRHRSSVQPQQAHCVEMAALRRLGARARWTARCRIDGIFGSSPPASPPASFCASSSTISRGGRRRIRWHARAPFNRRGTTATALPSIPRSRARKPTLR